MRGRRSGLALVVTGASSGIGRATAVRAAAEGHDLVLVARRESTLEEVAAECRSAGASSVQVAPADVADDAAVASVLSSAVESLGRLDGVLHCAGVVTYGRTERTGAEDFEQVVRTNLLGSANVARHTVPVLRRQERGVLVLVGSLLGHVAVPDMTAYVVSKWGVRALARQLSIENGDLPDVHVCHVAPGSVDTPIYDNAIDSAGMVNTPPPPTISPERAARVVLSRVHRPRPESQTALSNYGLLVAFRGAPRLWDRWVGPAFDRVSRRAAS